MGYLGSVRYLNICRSLVLITAQWLVIVVGGIAYWRVPGLASPRKRRLWVRALGWLSLVLVGLIGCMIYALPNVRIIPPGQLVAAAAPDPPRPNLARSATTEQRALAERGRYLFTITSCALCHGSNGEGGAKISWKPFGTLWTRNITPDPDTGIGKWTDGQISRAIRSGVAADGRAMHWQGMIWDHLSNLDEEDLRALLVYLRALPPVKHTVPSARAPAPDDCEIYTFWTVPSSTAGCR